MWINKNLMHQVGDQTKVIMKWVYLSFTVTVSWDRVRTTVSYIPANMYEQIHSSGGMIRQNTEWRRVTCVNCEVPAHGGRTENGIWLTNEINRSPATRSLSQSAGISKTNGFYGSSCVVIIRLKWNTTDVPWNEAGSTIYSISKSRRSPQLFTLVLIQ
jgi:hypothetical protein